MGCGSSSGVQKANASDGDGFARKCGKCQASCLLTKAAGSCSLCGEDISEACWRCFAKCGFLVCLTCELHAAMLSDSVERLRAAYHAFKADFEHASVRDAHAILEAYAGLEAATGTDDVWQVQAALATAQGFDASFVQQKVAELAQILADWEAVNLSLEAAIEGKSVELIAQNLQDAKALKLQKPDCIQRGQERIHQLQALTRLEEAMRLCGGHCADTLRNAIETARQLQMNCDLIQALGTAELILEKLTATQKLELALTAWDADALRDAMTQASRVGAVEDAVLKSAQVLLAKMEVVCGTGHRLRRRQEFRDACCHGCYADSRSKELSWYRCDLCDFDLCHHCLEWRAKQSSHSDESKLDPTSIASIPGSAGEVDPVHAATHGTGETQLSMRFGDETSQRDWFNYWAVQKSASMVQWELFRGGCWVPCGRGLSNWLMDAWQSGAQQAEYTAINHQKHLFDFSLMEQVILSTGKRRPMRQVLWEVELDMGWFLVEDDLALRLRANETCGVASFQYEARNMQYTIDITNLEQVNDNLGTRRKLRKIPVNETPPKMSRQQLRMALEDSFSSGIGHIEATASDSESEEGFSTNPHRLDMEGRSFWLCTLVGQLLILRWPWQELGDCSMDADGFIRTGLAEEIASGLQVLQHSTPQLGTSLLHNIVWFHHVGKGQGEPLSQSQVADAIVRDPRWRWGHAGAEDACSALWTELSLKDTGVEKQEFLVAGGLADELVEILNSDLESVDDWIMEKKLPLWDGQDCAVCFCPIGKSDVGRRMRCSCWLHFECLGHGLGVKISERKVDDEQMSMCPACTKDLGRVIPPGVVHRAVGDNLFARYLDLRVEVQWQKEAFDSGRLVAKCPSCSFLVLCNEQEEMYSIKCLRQSCSVDRFCAYCSLPEHRPWTCGENERRKRFDDSSNYVRDKIAEALAAALYRNCTGCGVPTERTDACCHMTCSHCRAEFSWVCGADYALCRASHPCLNSAIYLHCMPQLVAILHQRGLPPTDENGSDLFLELRCLYLLSYVKREFGDDLWRYAREQFPEMLNDVIRGHWSIAWDEVGNVERLTRLLPMAFPPLSDSL